VRWAAAVLAAAALAAAVTATGCTAATAGTPAGHAASRTSYYLSLGDSLSQGTQPDRAGTGVRTQQGYPNQLYTALHRRDPGLRLVKLGCPGETTSTMINGGHCRYAAGSQLAAAVSFLRAHRGRVSLITIDIGGDDPHACVTDPTARAIAACAGSFFPETLANLAKILTAIRRAAGDQTRVIGMTYYVPTLALWRDGRAGQSVARLSELVIDGLDQLLANAYRAHGAQVADVFGAFRSTDFSGLVTVPGIGKVPPNVAAICQWTWECARAPRGPNVHATTAGYGVIAQAFLQADS
jgi:lysophospholipase L1-like esterase